MLRLVLPWPIEDDALSRLGTSVSAWSCVIVGVAKLRETSVRGFVGDAESFLDFVGEEFADSVAL
jgi:hypothetical protein